MTNERKPHPHTSTNLENFSELVRLERRGMSRASVKTLHQAQAAEVKKKVDELEAAGWPEFVWEAIEAQARAGKTVIKGLDVTGRLTLVELGEPKDGRYKKKTGTSRIYFYEKYRPAGWLVERLAELRPAPAPVLAPAAPVLRPVFGVGPRVEKLEEQVKNLTEQVRNLNDLILRHVGFAKGKISNHEDLDKKMDAAIAALGKGG
jgi:hypothetical protein